MSYIDRVAIKRFRPGERFHPRSGDDAPFEWYEHRQNWVLERWAVREHGVILVGPDPRTLIDPITPEEIREAVASELRIRVDDWATGGPTPGWLLHRGAQVFEVETVCRALHTLSTGELRTKPRAVTMGEADPACGWQPLLRLVTNLPTTSTDESRSCVRSLAGEPRRLVPDSARFG